MTPVGTWFGISALLVPHRVHALFRLPAERHQAWRDTLPLLNLERADRHARLFYLGPAVSPSRASTAERRLPVVGNGSVPAPARVALPGTRLRKCSIGGWRDLARGRSGSRAICSVARREGKGRRLLGLRKVAGDGTPARDRSGAEVLLAVPGERSQAGTRVE